MNDERHNVTESVAKKIGNTTWINNKEPDTNKTAKFHLLLQIKKEENLTAATFPSRRQLPVLLNWRHGATQNVFIRTKKFHQKFMLTNQFGEKLKFS